MKKIICLVFSFLLVFSTVSCAQVSVKPGENNSVEIHIGSAQDNTVSNSSSTTIAEQTQTDFDAPVTIHFFDVGQADSALIECDGEYALFDCGNIADGKLILNYLKENNISKLKYLYISHPHEDHLGGAATIVKNVDIETTLMPNTVKTTSIYEKLIDALLDKEVETISPEKGDEFNFGGGKFKVLACDNESSETNDNSIVLIFTYGDTDVLFTGDATTTVEKEILSWYQFNDIEVLKLAHHGSKSSSSMDYLSAVNPDYIVISVGRGNDYGHPTEVVMNRLSKLDAEVFRTDLQNTVIMKTDGKNVTFETSSLCLDGDGDGEGAAPEAMIGCDKEDAKFIASDSGKKYHTFECSYAKKISEDKAVYFSSKDEAEENVYEACKSCNP